MKGMHLSVHTKVNFVWRKVLCVLIATSLILLMMSGELCAYAESQGGLLDIVLNNDEGIDNQSVVKDVEADNYLEELNTKEETNTKEISAEDNDIDTKSAVGDVSAVYSTNYDSLASGISFFDVFSMDKSHTVSKVSDAHSFTDSWITGFDPSQFSDDDYYLHTDGYLESYLGEENKTHVLRACYSNDVDSYVVEVCPKLYIETSDGNYTFLKWKDTPNEIIYDSSGAIRYSWDNRRYWFTALYSFEPADKPFEINVSTSQSGATFDINYNVKQAPAECRDLSIKEQTHFCDTNISNKFIKSDFSQSSYLPGDKEGVLKYWVYDKNYKGIDCEIKASYIEGKIPVWKLDKEPVKERTKFHEGTYNFELEYVDFSNVTLDGHVYCSQDQKSAIEGVEFYLVKSNGVDYCVSNKNGYFSFSIEVNNPFDIYVFKDGYIACHDNFPNGIDSDFPIDKLFLNPIDVANVTYKENSDGLDYYEYYYYIDGQIIYQDKGISLSDLINVNSKYSVDAENNLVLTWENNHSSDRNEAFKQCDYETVVVKAIGKDGFLPDGWSVNDINLVPGVITADNTYSFMANFATPAINVNAQTGDRGIGIITFIGLVTIFSLSCIVLRRKSYYK